jgi:hypothetical protein
MKISKTTILIGAIAIILSVYAFKSKPESKSYSYLTMHSIHYDLDDVFICIAGKEYKKIHLVKQTQGAWDLNPLINLINQYESEGWELQNINGGNGPATFVWMRKEK